MPLTLFLLSTIVLTLEVLETKIFAYSLENNLIFLVVGVVLLGFGAGGTVLSLRKELGDPVPLVRRNLLLTAMLLIVAHAWFALFSDRLVFRFEFFTLSILVLLASPYFSAGMAISAILADTKGSVHVRYGINLLGSALGCMTVFLILGPLSGPQCLVLCALVCGLLAVPLYPRPARVKVLGVVLVMGVGLLFVADSILPYQIQSARSGGQLALIVENSRTEAQRRDDIQKVAAVQRFDRWDPTARVQVHSLEVQTTNPEYRATLERLPAMWFTQDSSYGSPLIGSTGESASGLFDRTCYGVGYFRGRKDMAVLVIGLGGAPDVQTALHHQPRRVDGVDINATTLAMVRDHAEIKAFLGDPYGDPRVHLHQRDGRSFVRGAGNGYDLIQLSGVDTKSVLASGTLALNESYLYTEEAFDDYLERLEPGGILCILYAGKNLRDRLAITAMQSLENAGSKAPHRHLVLVEQNAIFCMLVKKTAFTKEECRQLDSWLERCDTGGGSTGVVLIFYDLLNPGLSLAKAPKAIFVPDGRATADPLMQAVLAGKLDDYITKHPMNLAPAPDWRPFFFNITRNEEVWNAATRPAHFQGMFNLLWIMLVLALGLITGPLILFQRHGIAAGRHAPFALYFAALGTGFILAMSGLIQRYVLFLGHQAYAFAVVIGGLLVAAGVGSILAGKFE
ncbi:MAG: spermidine synthase, partial [Planctomycetota bacterium]